MCAVVFAAAFTPEMVNAVPWGRLKKKTYSESAFFVKRTSVPSGDVADGRTQGRDPKRPSPLAASQAPSLCRRSSCISEIVPSDLGPTFSSRLPFLLTISTSRATNLSGAITCSGPSTWLYPKLNPRPRHDSHFFSVILLYLAYSGVVKSAKGALKRLFTNPSGTLL